MLDKSYVVECVRRLADLVRHDADIQQVILFGSYSHGTANDESDIDVAVVTDTEDNWWPRVTDLWRMCSDVDSMIEPHLMYSGSDRSGFLEEIRRTGVLIYERQSA